MLSLRIPRLARHAFVGPLAVALQAGLASLAAPSVVRTEGVADAQAPEEMARSMAATTPEASLPAARARRPARHGGHGDHRRGIARYTLGHALG